MQFDTMKKKEEEKTLKYLIITRGKECTVVLVQKPNFLDYETLDIWSDGFMIGVTSIVNLWKSDQKNEKEQRQKIVKGKVKLQKILQAEFGTRIQNP